MSSIVKRFVVAPCARAVQNMEGCAARKLATANAATVSWIAQHEASGTDAATMSTRRYLNEQRQLMSYRVVRFFEEARHLTSGAYFKDYGTAKLVMDVRFLTKALFLFLIMTIVGRQSIFPPIHPDSPLAVALDHKVNPNY